MQDGRRQFLYSAAGLLGAWRFALSQEPPTFSTDIKVVDVLATVRNKRGEYVRDLTKDDFQLLEDGRPQVLRYFSQETNLPLTLGLMVDTSMSQRRVMAAERGASFRFFDEVLTNPKDRAFIVQFDLEVHIRQSLTSSLRDLEDSLSLVDTPSRRELQAQTGGGTLLYDAMVTASDEIMKKLPGRKALIVLSDGVDFGSAFTLIQSVEAALRTDTLIYSILFSDEGGSGGKRALEQMAKETGGTFFEVSKKQTIDQIFESIQQELRSQYNLGYVSDKPVQVSEFRRIQLTTRQKGLTVQARDKYWAKL
jgi:VWFA-related protein